MTLSFCIFEGIHHHSATVPQQSSHRLPHSRLLRQDPFRKPAGSFPSGIPDCEKDIESDWLCEDFPRNNNRDNLLLDQTRQKQDERACQPFEEIREGSKLPDISKLL